ncbi:hypothetical protein [Virgisporangium aurantiacum]|uniref:Uncharacterized protein n=1 Tax=Virgisporangium aurantiacum TaxID=175570 RepID=A0A8J3ZG06_9ACTN|nr:hypothetical protein [Virgisporangium aurantiacum]GIJ62103.1 hypothetical protein Vau01_096190 [Virgisporangium aurantiacum]
MLNRILLGLYIRTALVVADQARRLRRQPDAGMETADKILWAAAITIVVGVVGGIFRTKLRDFANGLSITLGW